MAKELRIPVVLPVDVDKASLDAAFDTMERSWLDVESAGTDAFRHIADDADLIADAIKGLPDLDLDVGDSQDLSDLAARFNEVRDSGTAMVTQQKLALAALVAAGDEGSDAYLDLVAKIIQTKQEILEVAAAEQKVVDIFQEPITPNVTPPDPPDDDWKNLFNLEALDRTAEFFGSIAEKGAELVQSEKQLGAATGLFGAELDRLGDRAETAFVDGVGGSLAEATKIMGVAQNQLGSLLDPEQLDIFTQRAAGIGQVFDKDVNEVLQKSRTFLQNFDLKDGAKGADLIALAMQKAGGATDDVLDTLDEYSQLWKQTGLNAEQAVGLITSGVQAGARDTDKIADSLKELQIRLKAGDISTALKDISSPITATIAGIVKAGEQGKKSAFEVAQETAQVIETAFDAGQISESVRSKLQVGIAGTPAEDLGSELYGRIFSAEIDTSSITAQASLAGQQMSDAIAPGFVGGIQKQFGAIVDQAAAIASPIAAAAGTALSGIGQLAPGITAVTTKIGELGGVSKAFTSIGSSIASAGSSALAFATGPVGLTILAVAALTAGIVLLVDALSDSNEELQEQNKAEQELVAQAKAVNLQQQERVKNTGKLAKEYESLGSKVNRTAAEEKRLGDIQDQIGEAYPGLIKSSKSFSENLGSVKSAAANASNALKSLKDEMVALDRQSLELAVRGIELQLEPAMTALQQSLRGGLSNALGFGGSELTEALTEQLAQGINKARTASDVQAALNQLQQSLKEIAKTGQVTVAGKLFDDLSLSATDETEIRAAAAHLAGLRKQMLDLAQGKKEEVESVKTIETADGTGEVKETLDFATRIAAARVKAGDILAQVDIKNATSEVERIKLAAKTRRETIDRELETDLKQAEKEAKEFKGDVKGLAEFLTARKAQAAAERAQAADEESKQIRDLTQKLMDAELAAATQLAQQRKETASAELEALTVQQDALGATTAAGLRERLELTKQVQAAERELLLGNLVTQNVGFKKEFAEQQELFKQGKLNEEQFRQGIADLRGKYQEIVEDSAQVKTFDIKVRVTTEGSERGITLKQRQEEIAKEQDLDKQNLLFQKLELEQKLADDLKAVEGNLARQQDLRAQYRDDIRKLERDFLRANDVAVAASLALQETDWRTLFDTIEEARNEDVEKQQDALDKQQSAVLVALQEEGLAVADFFAQRAEMAREQAELEQELARSTFDVWDGVNKGLSESSQKVFDQYQQSASEAGREFSRLAGLSEEELTAAGKTNEDVTAAMEDAWIDTSVAFAGAVAEAAFAGENILAAFATNLLEIASKTLEAQIPGLIALIFGKAFAEDPLFGAIVAGIATAALYGLVGIARNALNNVSFAEGGLTPEGGPQLVVVNDDARRRREFIMPGEVTEQYLAEFEQIRTGADPYEVFAPEVSNYYVDPAGQLGYLDHELTTIVEASKDNYLFFLQCEMLLAELREQTKELKSQTALLQQVVTRLEAIELRLAKQVTWSQASWIEHRATNDKLGFKRGYASSERDVIGILIAIYQQQLAQQQLAQQLQLQEVA